MDDPRQRVRHGSRVFEWDSAKNRMNVRKHRLSFDEAVLSFDGPTFIIPDDREDYGEERWICIGFLGAQVVTIVFVELDDATIRVISARKAVRHEQRLLFESLAD